MGLTTKAIGKPRLLIILNRFVIGGQAVDTIPLAYLLQPHFNILILYGEKEKDEIEPTYLLSAYPGLQLQKISQLRRSINPFTDVIAFARLLQILAKYKPHVVHTHGAKSGFLGRMAAWLYRVPVIVHTFHGHFFHSYFSAGVSQIISMVERLIGRITTAAIALSEAQKTELVEDFKIMPSTKVNIIPLGFAYENNNNKAALRNKFRSTYGLQNNDVAIGIVGRIVPVKNHQFFLQVIKQTLTDGNNNAAFLIIGDGELKAKVEDELKTQQVLYNHQKITSVNRVVFTSWIMNMYEVMNGLDIIALTSLNEGTPLSIIEAQFFSKPVVSTNVGGVKDTLQDGLTGFLVEKTNTKLFAEKLKLLINNEDLRLRMGSAGNAFAASKFSKEKEVSSTKDFYFSLLRQKGYHFNISN